MKPCKRNRLYLNYQLPFSSSLMIVMGRIWGNMENRKERGRYPTDPTLFAVLIKPTVPSVDPYISVILGIWKEKKSKAMNFH
jgi:hypothetical protein